jgi:hypothetical protein
MQRSPLLNQSRLSTNYAIHGFTLVVLAGLWLGSPSSHVSAQDSVPTTAVREIGLSNAAVDVRRDGDRLFLSVQPAGIEAKRVSLPRLYAVVQHWGWSGTQAAEINLISEPTEWILEWTGEPPQGSTIELHLESASGSLAQSPVSRPAADGSIWLGAHQARTTGRLLRYEPQPHKNTVGYWADAADTAAWDFELDRPGHFAVSILQGCGAGQGGSDAMISVRQETSEVATIPFQVEETGHFQNFRWRTIGHLELNTTGRHELKLGAVKIADAALIDVRAIHLVRQANADK